MAAFTKVNPGLLGARRWRGLSVVGARMTAAEIAWLLALGALAACLVSFVRLRIPLPGHAILMAALPMAAGLASVPRRTSGTIISAGGGLTAFALAGFGVGMVQSAALMGLLTLGPLLDVVLRGNVAGWRLYAKFLLAGSVANLGAFGVRLSLAVLEMDPPVSRPFASFWGPALLSFLLCGGAAGLASAALCFRPPTAEPR